MSRFYGSVCSSSSKKNVKSFTSHRDPCGDSDLMFCGCQPDTGLCWETTDMGLVQHVVYPFTTQLSLVLIPTDKGMTRLMVFPSEDGHPSQY